MSIEEFRAWLRQPATWKTVGLVIALYLLLALMLAVCT